MTFPTHVIHGLSDRQHGNLSFLVGDDPSAVTANRRRFAEKVGIDAEAIVISQLIHGTNIVCVNSSDVGRGALDPSTAIPHADGLLTNETNVPLLVIVADCAALSVYDPIKKVIGVVHVGWRGAAAGIIDEILQKMSAEYGSQPVDIMCEISPCLHQCCFEVGSEVKEQFVHKYGTKVEHFFIATDQENNYMFDFSGLIQELLIRNGLQTQNIEASSICTSSNTEKYFSYRAEKGKTGRFGSVMMLTPGNSDKNMSLDHQAESSQ
ncbi:MAG TPA: peptidoglycan editing factor PgeF [Vitreimonas sp.]|nr:peptidoglycan editing factor PgeF [Vitreimonas sp.]